MKKIISNHFDGNNFVGHLIQIDDGSFIFGYDAEAEEPNYHVFNFKTESEFFEFAKQNYSNFR